MKCFEENVHYICPECHEDLCVMEDHIHDEVYCKWCGVVLRGPPVCGIFYPPIEKVIH